MAPVVLNEVNLDVEKWYVFQIIWRSLVPSKVMAFFIPYKINLANRGVIPLGDLVGCVLCVGRNIRCNCSIVTGIRLNWNVGYRHQNSEVGYFYTQLLDEGYESDGTQVFENVDDEVPVDDRSSVQGTVVNPWVTRRLTCCGSK